MSDELDELQQASIVDEEVAQDSMQPTTEEVDIETLKAKAEKADEYKKYADRVAAENARLKKSQDLSINNQSPQYATKEDVEETKLLAMGYSRDEVSTLMRYGGTNALQDQFIMQGIENARKAKKSQNATPSGTAKSPVLQKYTERDLKNMPLEELEKIMPRADY